MDSVLYWNDVALEADRTTHTTRDPRETRSQGPVGASRALAIVHLAIHDAYVGIHGGHATYLGERLPAPPPGLDADSAIAAAARATLSALYPAQKAFFEARHAAAGLVAGKPGTDGQAFGLRVATELLALRRNDPDTGDDGYAPSLAPGRHRQDPDNPGQGFHAPFYGARSRCFAVTTRHQLDAPPQPGEPAYVRALRQVRSKGVAPHLMATLPPDAGQPRTPQETNVGIFWAYDGADRLGTPPRLYNQIVRSVAVAQGNDVAANARLFALVNAAMGDAGVLCWTEKYTHDLWRPVLGIREHDASLGPAAVPGDVLDPDADPGWLPLGAPNSNRVGQKNFTPPFPAYPSGHATFGAAALQSVRQFYGCGEAGADDLAAGLRFVSEELNGGTVDNNGTVRPRRVREFPGGLWQMIEENGLSRVYLGVHWVFDAFAVDEAGLPDLIRNVGGVPLGVAIADDIAARGLVADQAAGPAA